MALRPGRYPLGPDRGRLIVRTFRDGLAATAGHDLTIEIPRWSGELTATEEMPQAGLTLRFDLGSLVVREGAGGLKPLSDRDRREIAVTARKVLGADRFPQASFTADGFTADDGGWQVSGSLTIRGQTRPVRLQARETADARFRVTGSVVQSEFGIKPYTAFLGALRVRDAVDIEAEAELTDPAGGPEEPS